MKLMYLYFFMKPTVDSTFKKPNYERYTKSPPLFFKLFVSLSGISQPPNHRTLNLFSCFCLSLHCKFCIGYNKHKKSITKSH